MVKLLLYYLIALGIFLIIDFIWLAFIARKMYQREIGHLMGDKPNFLAAFIFYLIYIVGVLYFALLPALEAQQLSKALISGALFGFVAYATYDFTNLATLRNWPIKVTILDLIWGSFVTATTSGVSFLIIYMLM